MDSSAHKIIVSSQAGLIVGFAAMLILMLFITLAGVNRMEEIKSQLSHHIHTDMSKVAMGAEMRAIAKERTLILHRMLYLDDPFARDESEMLLYEAAGKFSQTRLKLMAMDLTNKEEELLALQGKQANIAVPLLREVIELSKTGQIEEARRLYQEASMPAQSELIETMKHLYATQMHESHMTTLRVNASFQQTRMWMYLTSFGVLVLGVVIATIVIRRSNALDREKAAHLALIHDTHNELQTYSSELLLAHDAAQQSSKAKSQFLANMSHELRTPMNAIMGFSELLLEDALSEGNNKSAKDLKRILDASNHLLELINQILDLAKVESGKAEVNAEEFDIHAVITEVLETIKPLATKHNNLLEIDLDAELDVMNSDQTMFRQILFNLLSNAVKFTEDGRIDLRARKIVNTDAQSLELVIKDSGIGIAKDEQERIFHPFEQADGSYTRQFGGTGLGLALVKYYCILLSGEISVESELGQGTSFIIHIPLAYQ
ncbi:MAG: ATP-binding protein [Gammaproteobacteria bacterium]|nr:ATP-binding protein [Gammaproteobacteria bacterium]